MKKVTFSEFRTMVQNAMCVGASIHGVAMVLDKEHVLLWAETICQTSGPEVAFAERNNGKGGSSILIDSAFPTFVLERGGK